MRSPIVLALAVVIVSARAGAQDARAWEVDHLATLDAATVALVVPASTDGAPTRIRVRGTIDSTLDGAELDAVSVRHGGALDHALGAPLVLSPGAEVVQSDAALHRYVIEAPPGTPIRAALAISRLAAAHLVTATELRESLRGALEVEILRRPPIAPMAATRGVEGESPALGASALALVLALVGLSWLSRREPEEAVLLRRARRAREAIEARVRALGPAHHGIATSATGLETSVRGARVHLAKLDAALGASRWTRSDAARAERDRLAIRRASVRADLERMTGELESALVRLAAIEAERLAEPDLDAIARRLRDEVELGEEVERAVARM